jgi:hypothetical protein
LLVGWQESLIGGARRIVRRLRPKIILQGDSTRFGNPVQERLQAKRPFSPVDQMVGFGLRK